jgi:DNA-directed RNA polymerase specialized sigma24 family protein
VRPVSSTTTPVGRQDYLKRLAAIREDPQVRRLARTRAADHELAEDALQQTYAAMARVTDPERIEDLRAYFCRVLIRAINSIRGQLGAILLDDFASVADARQGKAVSEAPQRPLDESVAANLVARGWLERFIAERESLAATVPPRSAEPGRYRNLIVSVAGEVLRSVVAGDVCDADGNPALRTAYPEWFAEEDAAAGNSHQRFSRARSDVRTLLRKIVSRDDLYP